MADEKKNKASTKTKPEATDKPARKKPDRRPAKYEVQVAEVLFLDPAIGAVPNNDVPAWVTCDTGREIEDVADGEKWIMEKGEAGRTYRVVRVTGSITIEEVKTVTRKIRRA